MSAHKTWTETQRIPLGVHAIDHFIGIDTHAIKYHRQFVHERNVDVTLAVLNNLHSFSSLDVGDGIRSNFNDQIIDLLDLLAGLRIHA